MLFNRVWIRLIVTQKWRCNLEWMQRLDEGVRSPEYLCKLCRSPKSSFLQKLWLVPRPLVDGRSCRWIQKTVDILRLRLSVLSQGEEPRPRWMNWDYIYVFGELFVIWKLQTRWLLLFCIHQHEKVKSVLLIR